MYHSVLNHLGAITELLANKEIWDFINVSRGNGYLYPSVIVTAPAEKSECFWHTNNSIFLLFLVLVAKSKLETRTSNSYIHT